MSTYRRTLHVIQAVRVGAIINDMIAIDGEVDPGGLPYWMMDGLKDGSIKAGSIKARPVVEVHTAENGEPSILLVFIGDWILLQRDARGAFRLGVMRDDLFRREFHPFDTPWPKVCSDPIVYRLFKAGASEMEVMEALIAEKDRLAAELLKIHQCGLPPTFICMHPGKH